METRLLNYVEPIRRARGDFLYTYKGNRLVDLWKQGGRAILGHGQSHQLTILKNTLARGVWMSAPHPGMGHLEKALKRLFPAKERRIYQGLHRAINHIESLLGRQIRWETIPDPASPWERPEWQGLQNRISLWRPWVSTAGQQDQEQDILIPLLPFAWPESVAVLVLSPSMASQVPSSDLLSPVFAEYAQRAVYDLIKTQQEAPVLRVSKVLRSLSGSSIWKGSGLYWYADPRLSAEKYEKLFLNFLQEGFLLPPDPADPLILPWSLSPGLEVKLAKLLSFTDEA
ncbi:hypothetical protein [Gracilinema caldarium]|jgi:hypothetical protein|uniref:hypothetical protein n=1 Tax=Gracilinema caldarium TaxID=215591 RepID=UPI0026EFDB05|nr:hypothetical protein [Gracilinema caldarium]